MREVVAQDGLLTIWRNSFVPGELRTTGNPGFRKVGAAYFTVSF
jgi:hypothetical protein